MGVSGLWPDLYMRVAYRPENIVPFLHMQGWVLGVDVPVAVRTRWHSNHTADCVQSILDQHEMLTVASEYNPTPVKRIVYVFDNRVRNPLKAHEHRRREDARKRMRKNYDARQEVLQLVEESKATTVAELPEHLVSVPVVHKLLAEHTSVVVSEATNAPSLHTDLTAVAQAIRKKHKLDDDGKAAETANNNDASSGAADKQPPLEIYTRLMEEFDKRGIEYEISPDEAEHLLAAKCQRGEIDVVVTTDSDALLFGAPRVLRNFNPLSADARDNVIVELDALLQNTQLTRAQLVDIGIMAGSDFTEAKLDKFGVRTALQAIYEFGSLEGVLEKSSKARVAVHKIKQAGLSFDYEAARALFLKDDVFDAQKTDLLSKLAEVAKWNAGLFKGAHDLIVCLPRAQLPTDVWCTLNDPDNQPDCITFAWSKQSLDLFYCSKEQGCLFVTGTLSTHNASECAAYLQQGTLICNT
jgi:5'-3' exonuclease